MALNIGFQHGIVTTELPTPIVPLTQITAPTVVFGTAPIHLATTPAEANVPILCSSLSEFVAQFGWSDDFDSYTLCEAAKCHFTLYNVAPVVFVNVLDPLKHAKTGTATITKVANPIKIAQPVLLESVKITSGTGDDEITLEAGDFTAAHDSEGNTVILVTATDKILDDAATVTFRAIDPTAVTSQTLVGGTGSIVDTVSETVTDSDIDGLFGTLNEGSATVTFREVNPNAVTSQTLLGGVDALSGRNTGLEVIEDVYPRLGVIPGTIIAPKFSADPAVALVMAAKSNGINGCFKALAISDLSTTTATRYTEVTTAKTGNNLNNEFLAVCWPKVSLGGEQYHLSTQLAALMCTVDAAHDLLPYKSPSNEFLQCDSSVLSDGGEIYLGKDKANYVNSQGVVTALNFGGYRSWGNHVSAYPNSSDPINFIAVRRMMNWICNTLTTNFFSRIDSPMNRVLVDAVLDSVRIWLNGLASRGAILGGDIAFLEEDNPTTELEQGNMNFRLDVGFVVPAQRIKFTVQFNPSYFSALFTS